MDERGSVKAWVIAFVIFAASGFGLLLGVGCLVGANVCPGSHSKPFTSTDGATIFAARCAQCHGINGEGGRGPSLVSGDGGSLPYDELVAKTSKGRPFYGMPAFEFGSRHLSRQQIEAVARYVATALRGK